MSPPATAARWPADWPANQSQTGAFHIDIGLVFVYILRVSLASRLACISTWLHRHSFHRSSIFALSLYSFIRKILRVGPMDTMPTRGSFPCPPNGLPPLAPHPWLGMMPDTGHHFECTRVSSRRIAKMTGCHHEDDGVSLGRITETMVYTWEMMGRHGHARPRGYAVAYDLQPTTTTTTMTSTCVTLPNIPTVHVCCAYCRI